MQQLSFRLILMSCLVSTILPIATGGAAEDGEGRYFRVYPLGFASLEQAEAVARSLVEEGGAIIPDRGQQRLLVHATESEHRRLAEALAAMNRPPQNIRIDVEWNEAATIRDRGIGAGGIMRDGHTTITLTGRDQETHSSGRTSQTLVVASGREALLRVGERVPWLEWIEDWGWRSGVYASRVQWDEVGAFLAVEATVIGEGPMIRIRLTPELSGRVQGRPHRIRFAQASTEIIARAGETISLAGLTQKNEFYSHFLIGMDRRGERRSLNMTLKPTLLDVVPTAGDVPARR